MGLALEAGRQGLGLTSPNPPVGAVIVKDGELLGSGYHLRAGQPHAEIEAIRDAGKTHPPEKLKGATLFVTLEPCSTRGRTGACTDAILEAGFRRVVIGTLDPNPLHKGAALRIFARAGIDATSGCREKEARDLIRFFRKWITTRRPWVIAKTAITLDGHTTLPEGEGQWLTSEEAREDVQRIRRECDAILVGGETVRRDNPLLTLRGLCAEGREQPVRVVMSNSGDLPAGAHLFTDENHESTLTYRNNSLERVLASLGRREICSVMMESGGRLFSEGFAHKLIDEVVLYIAPILGGGDRRLTVIDQFMTRLHDVEITTIGPDVKIRGRLRPDEVEGEDECESEDPCYE